MRKIVVSVDSKVTNRGVVILIYQPVKNENEH